MGSIFLIYNFVVRGIVVFAYYIDLSRNIIWWVQGLLTIFIVIGALQFRILLMGQGSFTLLFKLLLCTMHCLFSVIAKRISTEGNVFLFFALLLSIYFCIALQNNNIEINERLHISYALWVSTCIWNVFCQNCFIWLLCVFFAASAIDYA